MKSILIQEIKKYWKYILLYFVFGIILNVSNLITNIINKQIMDDVFYKNNLLLFFNGYLQEYLLLLVIILSLNVIYSYLNTYITSNIDCNIKLIFHEIFINYPEEFFHSKSCVDIYYRIFNDLKIVYSYWIQFLMIAPLNIFYVGSILLLMFTWSKLLTFCYLVFMSVNLFVITFTKKRVFQISNKQKEYEQNMMNSFTGDFDKITPIKSMGIEKYILKSRKKEYIKLKDYNIKSNFMLMIFGVFSDFGTYIWNIALVSIGAILVCNKDMTLGEYVTFSTLAIMANVKVKEMFNILYSYPAIKASYIRVNNYLKSNEDLGNTSFSKWPIECDNIKINISDLTYNYSSIPIFENISYEFLSPSIINIIGRNGSGKTTLLKLIDRLIFPKKGIITINGIDYMDISNEEFRNKVFYLEQNPKIFNMTLRENIIFSNLHDFDKLILYYFQQLGLDLEKNFENGLDTLISNDGMNLSVGTIQKIAIIRLFLKKPKIILLDEPTASLDDYAKKSFTKLITEYVNQNNAICFNVTHDNIIDGENNIKIG